MASSSKRKTLSLAERIEVLQRLDNNESQASLAKHFSVHPSAISRILKQKHQLLDDWQNNSNPDRKRKRTGKADDVEEALLRWFSHARSRQLPVSGPLLMEKANSLAEDSVSPTSSLQLDGWSVGKNATASNSRSSMGRNRTLTTGAQNDGLRRCCQTSSETTDRATSTTLMRRGCIGEPFRKAHCRSEMPKQPVAKCQRNVSLCC